MNLPTTHSTLSQQIGALSKQLEGPSYQDVATGLKWLQDSGMKYQQGIAGDIVDKYHSVLKDVPSAGLKKAMTALRGGLYEHINHDFIPTPANMAAMARAEARVMVEEIAALRAKLPPQEQKSQHSKEHREKMIRNFATLKKALSGDKQAQREMEKYGWVQS